MSDLSDAQIWNTLTGAGGRAARAVVLTFLALILMKTQGHVAYSGLTVTIAILSVFILSLGSYSIRLAYAVVVYFLFLLLLPPEFVAAVK